MSLESALTKFLSQLERMAADMETAASRHLAARETLVPLYDRGDANGRDVTCREHAASLRALLQEFTDQHKPCDEEGIFTEARQLAATLNWEKGFKEAFPVFLELIRERHRQDTKHGVHDHAPGHWALILGEEYGEACAEFVNGEWFKGRTELIQTAAVALAWVESIDRQLACPPIRGHSLHSLLPIL